MFLEEFHVVHRYHAEVHSHELILGESSFVINFDTWKVSRCGKFRDTPELVQEMELRAQKDEKELAQFLSEVCLVSKAAGELVPTEEREVPIKDDLPLRIVAVPPFAIFFVSFNGICLHL